MADIVVLPSQFEGKYSGVEFEIIKHNRCRWEGKVYFDNVETPSMTGIKLSKNQVVTVIKNIIDNGLKNA